MLRTKQCASFISLNVTETWKEEKSNKRWNNLEVTLRAGNGDRGVGNGRYVEHSKKKRAKEEPRGWSWQKENKNLCGRYSWVLLGRKCKKRNERNQNFCHIIEAKTLVNVDGDGGQKSWPHQYSSSSSRRRVQDTTFSATRRLSCAVWQVSPSSCNLNLDAIFSFQFKSWEWKMKNEKKSQVESSQRNLNEIFQSNGKGKLHFLTRRKNPLISFSPACTSCSEV